MRNFIFAICKNKEARENKLKLFCDKIFDLFIFIIYNKNTLLKLILKNMQNVQNQPSEWAEKPQIFLEQEIPCVNITTLSDWTFTINEKKFIKIKWREEELQIMKGDEYMQYGNKIIITKKAKHGEKPFVYACDDYIKDSTFTEASQPIVENVDYNRIFASKNTPLWDVIISETNTCNKEPDHLKIKVVVNWVLYNFSNDERVDRLWFLKSLSVLLQEDKIYALWYDSQLKVYKIENSNISLIEENVNSHEYRIIHGIQIILQNGCINDIRKWEKWVWKNKINTAFPIKESWGKIYAVGDDNCLYCDDKKISDPVPRKFGEFRDFSVGGNKLILTFNNKFIQFDLPLMNNEKETSNNNHIFTCNAIIDDDGNEVFTEKNKNWQLTLKMKEFEHEILDVWEIIELSIDKGIITIIYKEKSTGKEIHKKISLNKNAEEVQERPAEEAKEKVERQEIAELIEWMSSDQLKQIIADAKKVQWLETKLKTASEERDKAKQKVGELELQVDGLKEEKILLENSRNEALGNIKVLEWFFEWWKNIGGKMGIPKTKIFGENELSWIDLVIKLLKKTLGQKE